MEIRKEGFWRKDRAMIKVVHTSDLHLDGTFFAEDQRLSERRRRERRALFVNIMMYARDRQVDVLLIAGDFFEGLWPEKETAELIVREFENTPGTEIFIAPGRHDPYRPGSFYAEKRFPSNVHIFKEERVSAISVERLGVTVYGYAFTGYRMDASPIAVMPVMNDRHVNLLCGYGSLSGQAGCAPITEEQIGNSGVDYAALGSCHLASDLKKEKGVYYSYSGAPEGCAFGENGHMGLRLLAIEKSAGACALNGKSMRFSRCHYEELTVDASAYSSVLDLLAALSDEFRCGEYDKDTILRLTFCGAIPLQFGVISKDLFEKIAAKLYYLEIDDQTTTLFEPNEETSDIKEGFATALCGFVKKEDPAFEKAMKAGLSALEGKPF
jgi:DNA repair exonuclease SbcCD nuclease subunit